MQGTFAWPRAANALAQVTIQAGLSPTAVLVLFATPAPSAISPAFLFPALVRGQASKGLLVLPLLLVMWAGKVSELRDIGSASSS